jgi:hypothetical protein
MQYLNQESEILLLEHNEGNSIETTLLEIHREISKQLHFRFI